MNRARQDEAVALFEPGQLREWSGFLGRSLVRHKKLAWGIFGAFAILGVVSAVMLPRSYQVSARTLAAPDSDSIGAARPSGGGPISLSEDAVNAVLSHQWRLQTVRDLGLVERWQQGRTGALAIKDRLVAAASGHSDPTPEEWEQILEDILDDRLRTETEKGSVLITLDWPDPAMAMEIVGRAQRSLLEARRLAEVAPLEERSRALDEAVKQAQTRMEQTVAQLEAIKSEKRNGARASTVRGLQAEGRWGALPDPRLMELRRTLLDRRATIQEQEALHQKRLAELQALQADQRVIYAANHPVLIATRERISALQSRAEEIRRLRDQEQALLAEYVSLGGRETELAREPAAVWPTELRDDDEALEQGRSRMDADARQVASLWTDAARVRAELASARAAFERRYAVIRPPEMPREPDFPNVPMVILSALLGGAITAAFASVGRELAGGARAGAGSANPAEPRVSAPPPARAGNGKHPGNEVRPT